MSEEKKPLNLLDATFLVAGSMIGSGIFIVSADMSRNIGGPGWLLLMWIVAGIVTMLAALSYGELAGMFPKAGGQYVYLKEAYNPLIAFLYGWALFLVVQCGTIAAVAMAFAKYTGVLLPFFSADHLLIETGTFKLSFAQILAIGMIVFLTFINSRGIHYGRFIVRLFTSTKLLALLGLIVLGMFFYRNTSVWQSNIDIFWSTSHLEKNAAGSWVLSNLSGLSLITVFGVAMVGSLFSADAWNNVTFISGDIQNPKRNLPMALLIGTSIVITLYVLANVAYLNLLPLQGNPNGTTVAQQGIQFANADRVGTAAATMIFGNIATVLMAILIMVSTFGCNNGVILASARVFQTMANDNLFFSNMKNNNRFGVPAVALFVQCIWSSLLCLSGKYGDLLDYVMFAVMLFYILTIAGIFILRKKQPDLERPYKAFGYPVLPALYILFASAFCINLLVMKPMNAWPGLIIVLLGIPVFYYWKSRTNTVAQ